MRAAHPFSWVLLFWACFMAPGPAALAADWPTYRGDARRSGYSPEDLPRRLRQRWVYEARHVPRPAWSGRDTRMPFDRAYHPVVADGMLYFGTSADCQICALDTATGGERWFFITDGPVRFAPAVWKGRVYAASDDGFLYCLRARDGHLLWKRRGGPTNCMVLGNDRMISRWPARGGPVIVDGTVYFAAGIWPSEGISIYALDAETGEVIWCNDTAGGLVMPQPHGSAVARSGISAQGYLVATGDRLLVPTGRAVPAALERASGRLQYFHLQAYGHGKGGSAVVATDEVFFNGGFAYDNRTGRLLGGAASPLTVAVTPTTVIFPRGDEIVGLDRNRLWIDEEVVDRRGRKATRRVPGPPVWTVGAPHAVDSLIAAGDGVIVGGRSRLTVLRPNAPGASWTKEIVGSPLGLAVASGRLFVSTDRGRIYCFEGGPGPGPARPPAPRLAPPYTAAKLRRAAAEAILRNGGVREGYAVDLGCGDGSLSAYLAENSNLRIYAIDSDPKSVALARKRLDASRLYGTKVTVILGDPAHTPFPDAFANLVFSWRSFTEGPAVVSAEERDRLLRPYGGVACIGRPDGSVERILRGPLEGAGAWTHQYCDPANTNCSADTVIRGPLGIRWFTDLNFPVPNRHGRAPAPLVLDGRLFIEGRNAIRAIDAYNGRTLWEHAFPGILEAYDQEHLMGTSGTGSNFCVTRDGVYVRTGGRCTRLDPATGRGLATFRAPERPDGEEGTWGAIACADGILFGTLANTEHVVKYRYGKSDMRAQFTESILLFALDARTGHLRWRYEPVHSIRNNALAIGGGRVYLIDRPLALADRFEEQAPKRRGRTLPRSDAPATLRALDAASGRPLWETSEDVFGTLLALSIQHDVLLMSFQDTRFKLDSETGGRMAAFRASDGRRLWDVRAGYMHTRPILNGRTIYAQPGAWDLLTGTPRDFRFGRSYGCGIPSGSRNLILFRSATLGYVDLLGAYGTENFGGIRPGCWINAIPAGGLVLMPDATDRCACSYLLKASIALAPYGLRPPRIEPAAQPGQRGAAGLPAGEAAGGEARSNGMSGRCRGTFSIMAAAVPGLAAPGSTRTARLWEPVQWKYTNPSCSGNPFDLVAGAVFTHAASGDRITTELFYDGPGTHTWTLRFTGTRVGRWSFTTRSSDPDLNDRTGSVVVQPNPGAPGFLTTFDNGKKWGKLGVDEAFVPQYVMYKHPDALYDRPERIDADIATFFAGHGFNGFHVYVLCRWFDLHKTRYKDFSTRNPNPDPRTFEALELLITKAQAAGGAVLLWAWGDEQRAMTPVGFDGGKNGPVDRRLQRYICARLGPLPGWSMGYGWDLQEWVTPEDLRSWHTYMQAHLGWDHFLGGRSPDMTQIYDGRGADAWFASYQQHRPDYDMYVKAIEELHPGRPVLFTDRFRVRENVYPRKDYTVEMTRRGLWQSTMAGGAGNIWGYLIPDYPAGGGSHAFPNRDQLLTWSRFFKGRFRKGMVRDNALTDGVCLRAGDRLYVFYKEETPSLEMDLTRMNGPQPAVAVDAKKPYAEIDLGMLAPAKQTWKAPHASDWAVAVPRCDAPVRPLLVPPRPRP